MDITCLEHGDLCNRQQIGCKYCKIKGNKSSDDILEYQSYDKVKYEEMLCTEA